MKLFVIILFSFVSGISEAQVGIGTNTPVTSAALDVTSTTSGLLPPRMTKLLRNNIVNPVAGLMIWCSDCSVNGEAQVYNGFNWTNMIGGPAADIKVGDIFGGGIVVYILQAGDTNYVPGQIHGLIVSPNDLNDEIWGCYGTFIGGTSTLFGSGRNNTNLITSGCNQLVYAARICNDLVLNGYTDWFLPSKDELNKIYLNRSVIGVFQNFHYWSSTQSNDVNGLSAWRQRFSDGFQDVGGKQFTAYIRAVRTF